MASRFLAASVFAVLPFVFWGQVSNNTCADAVVIEDPTNYCSPVGGYTNVGATPSDNFPASCFSTAGGDVWFSFVPVATTVTVTVIGVSEPGNTLRAPEVALYQGDCRSALSEWRCASDPGNGIVEFTRGSLLIGEPYYFRVQGKDGGEGSFELCVRNFNPPVEPGQDCPTMSVLCNKDPFVVQKVSGPGQDPTEANDATCFQSAIGGGNVESASTWFSWTAANDGSLTFDLVPLNPTDDLDFAVYELPNGPGNCQDKVLLRCMASSCIGPTGLRDGEIDLGEPPNCDDPRQNNYLAPLEMEAGKTYAVMVNNFSQTGNGFDMRFGGSGLFEGPEAAFFTDQSDGTVCVGEPVQLTDISSFSEGAITDWAWDFGATASPQTAQGEGPHTVTYGRAGLKSVVLTITTDGGCTVTEVGTVLVECCADHFGISAQIDDESCANRQDGAIDLTIDRGAEPYTFAWADGALTEDRTGIVPGVYQVTIRDGATCDTTLAYEVGTRPAFDIDVAVEAPSCDGGQDGIITLNVRLGTPPYAFNWADGGFGPDNRLPGLGNGDYQVVVRDQNACADTLLVPVRELDIQLDTLRSRIDPPSCFDASDGRIDLVVGNGRAPYRFDWADGLGPQPQPGRDNLAAGIYTVEVLDADRCRGSLQIALEPPPLLRADPRVIEPSCSDSADGEVAFNVTGGVRPYAWSWAGQPSDSLVRGVDGGRYQLLVRDANDCRLEASVDVGEPPPLDLVVADQLDVACFGEATGAVTLAATGGTGPYAYGLSGGGFQPDPRVDGLPAGRYALVAQDAQGCIDTVATTIGQAAELLAEAGPDVEVRLGNAVQLGGQASDPTATLSWSPPEGLSCVTCADPEAFVVRDTRFVLRATDGNGCVALDSMLLRIDPQRPVYFPNAFSPDGDGQNDRFGVFGGPGLRQVLSLRVFDRWGNLVFEQENLPANEASAGWDGRARGRELGTGIYVYLAEIEFIDDVVLKYGGDVLLLR